MRRCIGGASPILGVCPSRPPSKRRGTGPRGAPCAPPLGAPRPPMKNGAQGAGAVDPASPSGHYVEAPAAALLPLLARREFPKSRPTAGAMLISPMLFILAGSRLARFTSRRRDRQGKSAHQRCPHSFSSRSAAGRRGRGRSEPGYPANAAGGGNPRSHIAP